MLLAQTDASGGTDGITLPGFTKIGPTFGSASVAGSVGIFVRPDAPDGEQSWPLSTLSSGNTNWALFDFVRMDTVTPFDVWSAGSSGMSGDDIPSGTSPQTSQADEIVFAVHYGKASTAGVTLSGFGAYGFAQQAWTVRPALLFLSVAVLFADVAGQFGCTATASPTGALVAAEGFTATVRASAESTPWNIGQATVVGT